MSTEKKYDAIKRWESVIDIHKTILAEAIEAATAGSVMATVNGVTLRTEDGQELQITTRTGESLARVKIVSGDKTLDATPSGTFVVDGGESLTIDKGRIVRVGNDNRPGRAWALFALLSENLGRGGK
jgi:hypothetical protein